VAASATAASILAAAGIAFGLPGVTATKASTSTGSTGQKSVTHKSAKSTTARRHSSSSRSGLKTPATAPTSSSNAPAVSSGGS
jgi:hypothetical protein